MYKNKRVARSYPNGSRVCLTGTNDSYCSVSAGTSGTVLGVDGAGNVLVRWDDGHLMSVNSVTDGFVRTR